MSEGEQERCEHCERLFPSGTLIPVVVRGMQSYGGHVLGGRTAGGLAEQHVRVCADCRQNLAEVPEAGASIEDDDTVPTG